MMQATNAIKKPTSNNIWQNQEQQTTNMLNIQQQQKQKQQPIQPPYYQSAPAAAATTTTIATQQLQWPQQQQPKQQNIAATKNMYNNINTEASKMYYQCTASDTTIQTSNTFDFFENANMSSNSNNNNDTNNNNNNNTETLNSQATNFGNEWDWDWNWNDNPVEQQHYHHNVKQQQQQQVFNTNESNKNNVRTVLYEQRHQKQQHNTLQEDFNLQNRNNNWSPSLVRDTVISNNIVSCDNNNSIATAIATSSKAINAEAGYDNWNWCMTASEQEQKQLQQQQCAAKKANDKNLQKQPQQQLFAEKQMNVRTTEAAGNTSTTPLPPPPNEFSTENHNYNIQANPYISANNLGQQQSSQSQSQHNIPNSVFMSQAKPVTLPTRQYAAPPSSVNQQGAMQSPEQMQIQSIPPPPLHTFENPLEAVETLSVPLPPPQQVALSSALPNKENPFKRSGSIKHHNVGSFTCSTNNVLNMPPPPPADFANPLPPPQKSSIFGTGALTTTTLLEPENDEQPLQENQEIVVASSITLPNATVHAASALLHHTTPPNDERNQYLQTSHLSDITTVRLQCVDDEEQRDTDGLLPPPGLSRLVLGEPEIDTSPTLSTQRLVTGTETPHNNLTSNVSVMHLEERHADGEDTTDDDIGSINRSVSHNERHLFGRLAAENSVGNINTTAATMTTGNGCQQQRVVTGVELAEPREIELDGENLEDQQQQQQQSKRQNPLNTVARNEPPVEGAANNSLQPITNNNNNNNHTNNNNNKSKNNSNSSNNGSNNNANDGESATQVSHSTPYSAPAHYNQQPNIVSSPNNDEDDNNMDGDSDDRLLQERPVSRSNTISRSRPKYELEWSVGSAGGRSNTGRRTGIQKRSPERYNNSDDEELYSDNEEYSSEGEHKRERDRDREYRRSYRENSARSNRSGLEDDFKRKRHSHKHHQEHQGAEKRDKFYYDEQRRIRHEHEREWAREWERNEKKHYKYQQEQLQQQQRAQHGGGGRGADDHHHIHNERARRSDRSDPGNEFDDDYHYHHVRQRSHRNVKTTTSTKSRAYVGDDYDRRERRHRIDEGSGGGHSANEDYDNASERRRRGDKHAREGHYRNNNNKSRYDPREYEEYRKNSSRNARESDLDKDSTAVSNRSGRIPNPHNSRTNLFGYHAGAGYYDPYAAYYYNQMARTNPQAYAEWYKKYYSHAMAAAAAAAGGLHNVAVNSVGNQQSTSIAPAASTDDRESVHSGRSSAHNENKDRYTQAYIKQANEYQLQLRRHHHQQQKQQRQQQQEQNQHNYSNQTFNSTLLSDDQSYHNYYMGGNNSAKHSSGIIGVSKARSNSNLSQIHDNNDIMMNYYGTMASTATATLIGMMSTATAGSNALNNSMYYANSDYAESRIGGSSFRENELLPEQSSIMSTITEPQRLTPCKFMNEHSIANFSSGILITVQPKYNHQGHINSNVVKLLQIEVMDETKELFRMYPGPLMGGLSHKKTIIEFCEAQIRLGPNSDVNIFTKQQSYYQQQYNAEKYRSSYTLMWNLLILLLKQNGRVVGTDIAELLLQNQQQFPYTQILEISHGKSGDSLNSPKETCSVVENNSEKEDKQQSENDINDNKQEKEQPQQHGEMKALTGTVQSQPSSSLSSPLSILTESDTTEKFRQYLLYGNVNEALDWASDHNLWGHALFLASKLERRVHANVMMKFANKLPLNDPLQTLYQLMSGRTPCSVASILDEKWGDWRPHLSMIVSNTTNKPELNRKAITIMGDSLFMRGDLHAAHFCYLMAQVAFGRYQESAVLETTLQQHLPKLVLLGSSHYKPFTEFAISKAIIMTEIYEYACSLNDEDFCLIELQAYKYLLATRLLDCGLHLKSLMYLEQIANHIARQPTKYDNGFINKIYSLADRLKYYDPVLDKSLDDNDVEGTTTLSALSSTQNTFDTNNQSNNPQNIVDEQKWLQTLRNLITHQEIDGISNQQQQPQQTNDVTQRVDINKQFTDINKQFEELSLQYNAPLPPQQQQSVYNDSNSTFYESTQYHQHSQPQVYQMNQDNNVAQSFNTYGHMTPVTATMNSSGNTDYIKDESNNHQYWSMHQQEQHDQSALQSIEEDTMPNIEKTRVCDNTELKNVRLSISENHKNSIVETKATTATTYNDTKLTEKQQQQQHFRRSSNNKVEQTLHLNKKPTKATLKKSIEFDENNIFSKNNPNEDDYNCNRFKENVTTTSSYINTTTKSNMIVASSSPSITASTSKTATSASSSYYNPQRITNSCCNNNDNRPSQNITLPKTKSYNTDDDDGKDYNSKTNNLHEDSTGSSVLGLNNNKKNSNSNASGQQQKNRKNDKETNKKSQATQSQNSGWFGGIWNKFSLKPKNQMILPDDKNPTIVWNAEKKRWVNTDGDNNAEDEFKPPPKVNDIMLQQQQQQQQEQYYQVTQPQQQVEYLDGQTQSQSQHNQQQSFVPMISATVAATLSATVATATVAAIPTMEAASSIDNPVATAAAAETASTSNVNALKAPTLQSNMFKMQRNRTLKNSYVDVFNQSGTPFSTLADNILAPAMPPTIVPQGSYFIPSPTETAATTSTDFHNNDNANSAVDYNKLQQQQHQTEMPQFYNPNQFANSGSSGSADIGGPSYPPLSG